MWSTNRLHAPARWVALVSALTPAVLHAQQRCGAGHIDLGIRALACDTRFCAVYRVRDGRVFPLFSSTPRVVAITGASPGGLQVGDSIHAVDDLPITTAGGAYRLAFPPDQQPMQLLVERAGRRSRVVIAGSNCSAAPYDVFVQGSATPLSAPLPAPVAAPQPRPAPSSPALTIGLGLYVQCRCGWQQEPESGRWLWTAETPPRVISVARGSAADLAGIRAGDLLLQVNRQPFTSATSGDVLRRSLPNRVLDFMIQRGNDSIHVSVTPLEPSA